VIQGPDGRELSTRVCRDETEAWTYASTVRQHVYWLSDEKFREYYQPDGRGSEREGASGSPQKRLS
jgi:hypothetical protein